MKNRLEIQLVKCNSSWDGGGGGDRHKGKQNSGTPLNFKPKPKPKSTSNVDLCRMKSREPSERHLYMEKNGMQVFPTVAEIVRLWKGFKLPAPISIPKPIPRPIPQPRPKKEVPIITLEECQTEIETEKEMEIELDEDLELESSLDLKDGGKKKKSQKIQCPNCSFSCLLHRTMNRHGLLHLYKTRHPCPQCHHTFGCREILALHQKTHGIPIIPDPAPLQQQPVQQMDAPIIKRNTIINKEESPVLNVPNQNKEQQVQVQVVPDDNLKGSLFPIIEYCRSLRVPELNQDSRTNPGVPVPAPALAQVQKSRLPSPPAHAAPPPSKKQFEKGVDMRILKTFPLPGTHHCFQPTCVSNNNNHDNNNDNDTAIKTGLDNNGVFDINGNALPPFSTLTKQSLPQMRHCVIKHTGRLLKEEPRWKCPHPGCPYAARHRSHLKSHQIVHTREKNFSCLICNRRFGRKSEVNRHMRVHREIDSQDVPHPPSAFQPPPFGNQSQETKNQSPIRPFQPSVIKFSAENGPFWYPRVNWLEKFSNELAVFK